ncbi:MAG TPA: hypothetical protein DFR83_04315 [Deltaproteobacteria bacterium]|nr:hypothetical protein [Deltaproteobacteria bacterium]
MESGPATVTLHDTVAVIEPGTGAIALGGAASIVLDLRAPTTDEAVHQTLAALIQGDVEFAQRTVRRFQGFPSQDSDWTHYEVRNRPQVQSITGTADAGRPIVVLTGRTLTPATATLVGGLRMHGTVALAGHDIFASVAESHWTGIADEGLVWRSSILRSDSSPWPDVIPADLGTTDLAEVLAAMDALSTPGPVTGEMTRAEFANYDRSAGVPDDTLTRGAMRAALLVAYGTFDLFYTYFDLVGRDIDDALLAGLDEIDSHTRGDRSAMAHTMGRFMHALHDGHGFYFDDGREDWPDGWMALQIQEIDGRPVVRDSRVAGLEPGDTIVEVNGTAIEDWYAEAMGRYSAASDGYRFVLATDELTEVWRGTEWVVQAPDGVERGFAPVASTWEDIDAVPWGGTDRPNGWLADLGAPSVYYVNMAGDVTPDESNVVRELAAAESTTGVVLDMRDYPYLDIYGFAGTFNPTGYAAPTFGHPTWVGPDHFSIEEEVWTFSSARHVVDEPVVLLVSHKSVSAAECFAQMVMDLDNVTVVGQQSASTNGTITNAWLPGRWQVTFTGMQLTNPDGTDFHGIGVVPDVEVLPTADDFAAGIDPELLEALRVLGY